MEMKDPSGSRSRICLGIAKRPFESTFMREEPENIHSFSWTAVMGMSGSCDDVLGALLRRVLRRMV